MMFTKIIMRRTMLFIVHDGHDEKKAGECDHAEDAGDHDVHDEGDDDCKADYGDHGDFDEQGEIDEISMTSTAFSWEGKGTGISYKKD